MKTTAQVKARIPTRILLFLTAVALAGAISRGAEKPPPAGTAAWYGEEHRGKVMANGQKFDPDQLTAASWFYPLGAKVRVTLVSTGRHPPSVVVAITDRGPAKNLVHDGRIIDLARAAFQAIADTDTGLVDVTVERLE